MKYKLLHELPEGFLEIDVTQIHELLGGPTLIHLKGEKNDALYLSTLLHGNETTSFIVLQRLLRNYQGRTLPRDIIIFVGNTLAASHGMRHLPDQVDYNRIWDHHLSPEEFLPEHHLAFDVINYAKEQNIFASIDIHNNTGKNPNYGCINVVAEPFIDLASHFGSHTVYFTEPHNVQSMAFAHFCTAITIEAGKPGEESGVIAAYHFVEKVLQMDELYNNPNRENPEIYHTFARMKVDKKAVIDFNDSPCVESDLSFVSNLDENNFEVVPKGAHMGYAKNINLIRVEDNKGFDITDDFLKIENGELKVNRIFIPSMFTKDVYVMKEDCLGYVMELMIPTT